MAASLNTPSFPTHLVIVCCHAIYLGGRTNGQSDSEWLLAPFQKGETTTFISHMKTGLSLISSNPSSLLIISGSKTRKEVQISEARSYWHLCVDNGFWGMHQDISMDRVVFEEQALDSFGNLMYSLLKFWKAAGKWPEMITVVSHEFKRRRFLELHVLAARWPGDRVEFVGVDPDYMVKESEMWDERRAEEVLSGEREKGFKAWENDPLGLGKELREKREARNFWEVKQVWFEDEEDRVRSGVKSRLVSSQSGVLEEVLSDERQPWESWLTLKMRPPLPLVRVKRRIQ